MSGCHNPLTSNKCNCGTCLSERISRLESLEKDNALLVSTMKDKINVLESECAKYIYGDNKTNLFDITPPEFAAKEIIPFPDAWRDVKKELPPQDNLVLVFGRYYYYIAKYIKSENVFKLSNNSINDNMRLLDVTHWMYLPKAPR